ncbi:MAG: hypothetical protein ABSG32_28495 [Terriglobia bacterium]
MPERRMVICGLPDSGKTTFLAALWHLVTSREVNTQLRFRTLRDGDASHLNALAARWRNAKVQIRTEIGASSLVSMNLTDAAEAPIRLTFPDLSGESYRHMWEDRDCAPTLAEILRSGDGMLFFIHSDKIQSPQWVVDIAALSKKLGLEIPPGQEVPWNPGFAPTQVQIVDLLQVFRLPPLNISLRRLAVILSAWDKVAPEGMNPESFLAQRLPLLDQYLRQGAGGWDWRVYGVSAQGGEYERENEEISTSVRSDLDKLKGLDKPSTRIKVISAGEESHDLTAPIAWLLN